MSLGSSELGSAGAELSTIELAGLGSVGPSVITKTITDSLTFTHTATVSGPVLESITQTLVLTDNAFTTDARAFFSYLDGIDYIEIYRGGTELLANTQALVTQVEIAVVAANNPTARLTNVSTEVLGQGATAAARVTNIATEILRLTHVNTIVSISQTLSFTQDPSTGAQYNRDMLHSIEFNDSIGHAPGWLYNPHFIQTLSLSDLPARNHSADILHSIIFTQTAVSVKALGGHDTLGMTQTVTKQAILNRAIAQTLVFSTVVSYSHFGHLRQTLAFSENINSGMILASPCESGTLGDNELADFYLGLDCGTGGPNGFVTDTSLTYTSTVKLRRIYRRSISQTLTPTQTPVLGPWVRAQHISQTLLFLDKDFPKTLPIGTGTGIIITQPILIGTLVKPQFVIQSKNGAIVLPVPRFDDSVTSTNKLKITKVMSRKNYIYVKRSDRVQLSYTFQLGRRKAEEFREFFIANVAEDLTITNWKGEIYFAKFGNNPMEFETTGRYEYEFEKVMVETQFQGIKLYG